MTKVTAQLRVSAKPAPTGGATLAGSKWTPRKDAAGLVLDAEWAGLPKYTIIEWMGTAFEAQLFPPYGAAAGYQGSGSNPIKAIMSAFTGCAFDTVTGRMYFFGGGHGDGSINLLACFDSRTGRWSITIPPTHQSMYPPGYATSGNTSGFSTAIYPNGKGYNYFPSTETPAGDNAPCASHEWSGMVFVPGINHVLLPRNGWFHADVDIGMWLIGPQAPVKVGFKNRGGVAFQGHYLSSTKKVYLTSEGGQISNTGDANAGYYNIVIYDPFTRLETGVIGWDAGGLYGTSCVDADDVMWYFQANGTNSCQVSTVNLRTGQSIRGRTEVTGRRPGFGDLYVRPFDGENPVQYVPSLNKVLMWVTLSRAGEAQAGEMLEFDRATLKFELFPITGSMPIPRYLNNKMRCLSRPDGDYMVWQLATDLNARLIKLT